jgi:polysaccharide pyruvyl transferase WcaK-like protein
MNVLAPFGFYGWGNIGDESTLQGFAELVRQHSRRMRVWVASRNPAHTASVEPSFTYFQAGGSGLRARWAARVARAHVIAGGTPIMDGLGDWPLSELVPLVQSSVKAKRPLACVGIGVETLHREPSRRLVTDELAPSVVHWSVRGERDRGRLIDLGVPPDRVTTAADMAWLLRPVDTEFGRRRIARLQRSADRRPVVGVNINLERSMVRLQPRLTTIIAAALDRVIESYHAHVVFLCNEVREGDTFDKAAAQSTLAQMKMRDQAIMVPNDYFAPQQMLSLVGCCDVTVSSRYHFCLFSALQGVPFLALNRSDKVEDLCIDLNVAGALPLAGLDVVGMADRLGRLLDDRQAARAAMEVRVGQLRERARANLTTLDALTV